MEVLLMKFCNFKITCFIHSVKAKPWYYPENVMRSGFTMTMHMSWLCVSSSSQNHFIPPVYWKNRWIFILFPFLANSC